MRHGLMTWREEELSQADVLARQRCMQAAMRAHGLDAMLIYTNHVRSAAVTFLTGFTPYWADGILLLPAEGRPVLAIALSKRVGHWIKATNPTAEILHSPQPGRAIAALLPPHEAPKVGVHELERIPGALIEEIRSVKPVQLADATATFAEVRAKGDAAEIGLVRKADSIAAAAFATAPEKPSRVGDVTEALELSVRNAGAEECYVAVAPDLAADTRLARVKGLLPLGPNFAVRLSVAYSGVWIRRTESFSRSGADNAIAEVAARADELAACLDLQEGVARQIESFSWPAGMTLSDWAVEAPFGTRPLQLVTSKIAPEDVPVAYGVLSLRLQGPSSPLLLARPIGIVGRVEPRQSAA